MWRGAGELYNGDGLTHAASIAYYALLSLFPFLLLMLSLFGSVTAAAADRDRVVAFVFEYFPRQFEFITGQLDAFRASTLKIGVGGMVALVWASLGVFNAVTSAVNQAWAVEKRRSFLKHRLVGFLMLLSAGGILLIAIVIVSAAKVAQTRWFGALEAKSATLDWLSGLAANQLATLLLIGCVALIFYFIPNTRVRFRDVWPGAIIVGLLWRGALSAFSWYARDLASWNVIHGSVTTAVVFLLWIYVCAVILLYGVTMTAAYARLQDATLRHVGMTHAEG
ncbi:MAG TPA: YihY/virulence factor BrkB family protein [Vicinamibacterales bacterium]|nr:YihY/virulence factor BrkB family protein [Vicinamibacterales bacterium]